MAEINPIPESSKYDNYLDREAKKEDTYNISLDKFLDEEIAIPIFDDKLIETPKDYARIFRIHFKNIDDHYQFCNLINQVIPFEKHVIYYPLVVHNALFDDEMEIKDIDIELIKPKTKFNKKNVIETKDWVEHWHGMPEFYQVNNKPYKTLEVRIRTEADIVRFAELLDTKVTEKTKFIWFPKSEKDKKINKRWIGPVSIPKYPMYIVSKGRHETMFTSRTFAEMKVPHYIVIEPQDYDRYVEALSKFNINPYATLLVAPFSNHGDGPGRARNWAWDHSISIGAEKHWVFDDNIKDFYRLHNNSRYRIMTGAIFNAMEDFVDRYENIYIAGPQYYFFCTDFQKYPPYVLNTRIYSALLIRNDCKHRWRGRYNEDTDLSLRVLKDGNVTIQFNSFLQGKVGTQLLKGGNTAEFYHVEGTTDKEQWRGGNMNATGTINKSKMLVDMHPDVASLVWKYDRWHHHVNYDGFKMKLKLKPGVEIPVGTINNYGIEFTENYISSNNYDDQDDE